MEDILQQADTLNSTQKYQECYDFVKAQVTTHPESSELAWRFARANYDVAMEKSGDKAAAKSLLEKSLESANQALALDDKNYAAYKWVAISLSALSEHGGSKEKIENAFKIRDFALKAIELRPSDSTTLHLLGRWCFGVSNIGWIERKLASALFATPPQSTFEEALSYFQKADEIDPKFQRNLMYMGDTYANLKKKDEARKCYERLMALPANTVVEKELHESVATKLKKL